MMDVKLISRWIMILVGMMTLHAQSFGQQNPFEIKKRLSKPPTTNLIDTQSAVDSQLISDSLRRLVLRDSLRQDSILRAEQALAIQTQRLQDSLDSLSNQIPADSITLDNDMFSDTSDTLSDSTSAEEDLAQMTDTTAQQSDNNQDTASLLNQIREQLGKDSGPLSNSQVVIIFCILLMLFLSALLGLFRTVITKLYRGVANDNYLRTLIREYQNSSWVYWAFYIFFFLNLALYIFQLIRNNVSFYQSAILLLGLLVLVVFLFYFIKHATLWFLGIVFPIEKETYMYSFMTMVVNSLLGLVLFPINIGLAFGPTGVFAILAWLGIGIIVFLYIFRQLKGLFISARFLSTNRMHFFLYLCTIEIAPLLIVGKLLFDQIYF